MQELIANGRVASDLDVRPTANNKPSCKFDFVCDSSQLDTNNKPIPSFFHVQVYGKQAEAISQSLSKGSPILLIGEIIQRPYTDNKGVSSTYQYIAPAPYKGITFLESKEASQKRKGTQVTPKSPTQAPPMEEFPPPMDADSPF